MAKDKKRTPHELDDLCRMLKDELIEYIRKEEEAEEEWRHA